MKAIFVALVLVLLASGMCAADETTMDASAYQYEIIPDEKEYVWSLIGMFHPQATPIEWVLYV